MMLPDGNKRKIRTRRGLTEAERLKLNDKKHGKAT